MEVPQETTKKWQAVWQQICDMAYFRKNITDKLVLPINDFTMLLKYKASHCVNFHELTFDYQWQKNSSIRDNNNYYLEALVVPELKEIYVPRILFHSMGVFNLFKHSFPNCLILFWEDTFE
jgi:hypothetical protein